MKNGEAEVRPFLFSAKKCKSFTLLLDLLVSVLLNPWCDTLQNHCPPHPAASHLLPLSPPA